MTKNTIGKLNLISLIVLLLTLALSAQTGVQISRVEISSPWSGFYYAGQGQQLWGKAIVHNSSSSSLNGAVVRFNFFDPVGPRESFEQPLPSLPPGGTVSVESQQWWDYSGAAIGVEVTVYNPQTGDQIAQARYQP